MADLSYDITATVEGADAAQELADKVAAIKANIAEVDGSTATVTVEETGVTDTDTALGDIATNTDTLDGTTAAITVSSDGVTETATGLDDAVTAAGDLPDAFSGAEGAAGILNSTIGKVGIGIGIAGIAMNAATTAFDLGSKAWAYFNREQIKVAENTRAVSAALAENSDLLGALNDELGDLATSGDAFERLTAAVNSANPDALHEMIGALGDLGNTSLDVGDIGRLMADFQGTTEQATASLKDLAEQAGIPPEFSQQIAETIAQGGDLNDVLVATQDAYLAASGGSRLNAQDMNAARDASTELVDAYGTQIGALIDLRDTSADLDLEDVASKQLEIAAGADLATQALLRQAEVEVGPDASDLDTYRRFIELQNEAADTARWQDYANTMASLDYGAAALEGATTAMSEYTDALFAGVDAQVAEGQAYDNFAGAITDANGDMVLAFDAGTDAGRAQISALKGIAAVVDTELAEAYDNANGSQEDFVAAAGEVRDALVNELQNELGLTVDQANAVADALGLTEGDYEARFKLAGEEEARIKLGLLQGSIDQLPEDVQTTVTQAILVGDYTGAIGEVQGYYDANPPTAPLTIDQTGFQDEIGAITAGIDPVEIPTHPLGFPVPEVEALADGTDPVEIDTEADTSGAEDDIADVVDEDRTATIDADADTTVAAAELLNEASRYRVATIYALADFIAAKTVLDGLTDPRTAVVRALAVSVNAENELNNLARNRTATIFVRTVAIGGGVSSYATQRAVAGANSSNGRFGRS